MKNGIKTISIILVLIVLTCFAAMAGFGLAVWDTGSTVNEVFAMVFPSSQTEEIGQTQTIKIVDDNIGDYISQELAPKANIDKPITDTIADGIKPQNPDIDEDVDITAIIGNDDEDGSQPEEQIAESDTDEEVQPEKQREPLKITAEISGVATVVRAGDEGDEIENKLPVPTNVTEVATDVDPTADYPLPYQEVDLSYFDDALFIGDSRVAGLAMNSGTNATFYAVTSFQLYRYKTFKVVQTPSGKVPIFDVMPYDKFTKIYIKVGLNELGSVTDEPFLDAYTSLINDLRVMQPRAIIYIQAVLPVTQVKSQTDRVHCNENINKRNANLKSFAELMKCYYVDVGPYFADETGALKAETTADGIHMYSKYMPQWIDALRQNAVVWPPAAQ